MSSKIKLLLFTWYALIVVVFSVGIFIPDVLAKGTRYIPQVTIPESSFVKGVALVVTPDLIGKYIKAVYEFAILAIALLAVVMIMYAGYKWILAAGNAQMVASAKEIIVGAISGLVLILLSFIILRSVKNELTILPSIGNDFPTEINVPESEAIIKINVVNCTGDLKKKVDEAIALFDASNPANGLTIDCADPAGVCTPGVQGYFMPGPTCPKVIHVCPSAAQGSTVFVAGVITHEGVHQKDCEKGIMDMCTTENNAWTAFADFEEAHGVPANQVNEYRCHWNDNGNYTDPNTGTRCSMNDPKCR